MVKEVSAICTMHSSLRSSSRCWKQVFGKDSFMTLGAETDESRQQWAADMDTDVSHLPALSVIYLHLMKPNINVTTSSDAGSW